jgi:hypothetical protein
MYPIAWKPVLALLLAVATVVDLAGCHDPRAVEPTARRVDRIHHDLALAANREAEGPRRLRQTADLVEQFHRSHEAHLKWNLDLADKAARRDVRRWNEQRARRDAFILDYLNGDLEHAYRTIPWLLY